MMGNEFCKKLNEESHKHATIPESQRYGVHFEYHDLVNRLNKVKKERERKAGTNSSLDLRVKHAKVQNITERQTKKSLTNINNRQLVRHGSEAGLPNIKTPKAKFNPKFSMAMQSETNLRIEKMQKELKFHALNRKKSVHY